MEAQGSHSSVMRRALNQESSQEGTQMPPRMGPRPMCPQRLRGVCVQIQGEPRGCCAKPLEGEAWGQLSAAFAKDKDNCNQLQVSGRESSGARSQGLLGHPHAPGRLAPEPGPNRGLTSEAHCACVLAGTEGLMAGCLPRAHKAPWPRLSPEPGALPGRQ